MKQLILFVFITLILTGCYNEDYKSEEQQNSTYIARNTRSTDIPNDTWTNYNYCTIKGHSELIRTPWAENNVTTTIPIGIRKDVKKEDGWDILFSSVKINNYSQPYNYQETDKGVNYIIFYNHFNGLLKGFCYLPNVEEQNNMGIWHISTNDSTRLFNFAGIDAIPYNGPKSKDVYISNITIDEVSKGFHTGWNCFQIELAYDENSINETLNIDAICLNETSFDFTGTMDFDSQGVIITSTEQPQSNVFKGVATAIGDAANKYVTKNLEKNKKQEKGIVGKTIGSLIELGANKIFSSIFGKSSSKISEQTINIASKGNVKITGKSINPGSGIIAPISSIPLNTLGYALGIWNLLDYPIYQIESTATLQNYFDTPNNVAFRYKVETSAKYKTIINPAQKEYSTQASFVFQDGFYSSKSDLETSSNKIFEGTKNLPSLYTLSPMFTIRYISTDFLPQKSYGYKTPGLDLKLADKDICKQRTQLCVVEKFLNNDIYISAKTFNAKDSFIVTKGARPYWWTLKQLESNGYKYNGNAK